MSKSNLSEETNNTSESVRAIATKPIKTCKGFKCNNKVATNGLCKACYNKNYNQKEENGDLLDFDLAIHKLAKISPPHLFEAFKHLFEYVEERLDYQHKEINHLNYKLAQLEAGGKFK